MTSVIGCDVAAVGRTCGYKLKWFCTGKECQLVVDALVDWQPM